MDGRIIAATDEKHLSIFLPQSDKPLFHPRVVGYHVRRLIVTPDGRRVVVQSFRSNDYLAGEQFIVFDLKMGRRERVLRGHRGRIRSLVPRGRRQLLTGCNDGKLRLWDLLSGKEVKTIPVCQGEVRSVCVTRNGRLAVCVAADDTVAVWDLMRQRRTCKFDGDTTGVSGVHLSPKEELAISISNDWSLGVWDWRKGRRLATFTATDRIGPYLVLPDERTLVVAVFLARPAKRFLEEKTAWHNSRSDIPARPYSF